MNLEEGELLIPYLESVSTISKSSGIYKIESPSGRVYIGKAINLFLRYRDYKYLKCKNQQLLYKSILKYGFENHKFEILEECSLEELNIKERIFIYLYQTNKNLYKLGKGMNLTNGGEGSFGYVHTFKSKLKMREFQSSKINSLESNIKRSNSLKGRPASIKLIEKLNGSKQSLEHKNKRLAIHLIKVIDIETGKIYNSIKDAAIELDYNKSTLSGWLNGRYKNKSNIRHYKDGN